MASRRKRFSGISSGGSAYLKHSLGMPTRVSNVASNGGPGTQSHSQSQNKRKTYSVAAPRPTVAFGRQTGVGMGSSRPSVGSRPSVSSRPSTGSRSSLYGNAGQVKKDPRQLSDKAYQNEMLRKLKKFLEENNYPKTNLSVKQLQTPTCKEFLHIFNFLLELIDESLPINGLNLVEEVPSVLKMLGYPFTVSKNHLLNVGSPHSWPVLLGAITWLIDCCTIPNTTSQLLFGGAGEEFDEDEEMKREYGIEEVLYSAYMIHGDDSAEYQGMMGGWRDHLASQCDSIKEDTVQLEEDNAKLSAAVTELSKSSLSALNSQVKQNQADIEELTQYLQSQMIPSITEVQKVTAEADSHASEIEMQIMASNERVKELEEQIRHQPMSAMDAHDLHQNIKDAEDMLEMKRNQQEASSRRISELQMQHNRSVQLINNLCQEINGRLLRLAAVLPDAASLSPLDYETSKRADPGVLKKLADNAKFLRDRVQDLHRGVSNSITEYEGRLISAESAQSALHTELVRKELEVDNMQHNLGISREALGQKRKLTEEAMKRELTEKQALQKSLRALEQRREANSSAENDYTLIKQKNEVEMTEMVRKLERNNRELQELLIALTKFIEAIQSHQDGVESEFSELLKQFKELTFPTAPPKFLIPFDSSDTTL